jgi:hypothetical protein
MDPIQIVSVKTLGDLESHADRWNALAASAQQNLPMLSAAWVIPYLTHRLTTDETWRCLLAYRGDTLAGVLPVIVTARRAPGTSRPLLRTPWDFHTRSGDVLLAPGGERATLTRLLESVRSEVGPWFSLHVRGVVEGSPTGAFITEPPAGFVVVVQPAEPAAIFPVAPTQ